MTPNKSEKMTKSYVPPRTADKLILFGDSITQQCFNLTQTGFNFGAALTSDYQRRLDIVTRGYGGYTTLLAKQMIEPILDASISEYEKVALVVIFFGTNDANTEKHQSVPVDQYKENLCEITQKVLERGIKVVIVGPGLFDGHTSSSTTRSSLAHKTFCDAAGEVAKQLDVAYVPLWYKMAEYVGWNSNEKATIPGLKNDQYKSVTGTLFRDGLHYTGEGYKIYYDALKEAIAEKYPELVPERVTWRWPLYDDVDLSQIEKVLIEQMDVIP